MTNTIHNVPRELMERVLNAGWGSETANALDDLRDFLESASSSANHVEDVRAMVAAPSPAGVDGWRLVPIEPTREMLGAAEEAYMPFGDMDIALRMAVLSAPAPVQPVSAQPAGEYGDAYQGAREDLAIWKRRALEAEEKVRHQEQIIDWMGEDLNAINGPTFMGEPVLPTKAQGVVLPERAVIREVFLRNGFTIKEGQADLKPYVYAAAEELLRLNAAPVVSGRNTMDAGVCVTDCRSSDGVAVGIIDAVITLARVFNGREVTPAVEEALIDLRSDEDVISMISFTPVVSGQGVPDGYVLVPVELIEHVKHARKELCRLETAPLRIRQKLAQKLTDLLAAAPAAPAADAVLVEALDYQALFDAIAAATSVYANGAINISVQAFRDALASHRAKGVV